MKKPITDKDLGISLTSDEKFADVRQKAKDEYIIHKKKKDKTDKSPRFKIGERVVLGDSYKFNSKRYLLVEVIDFKIGKWEEEYFGIVLKSSHEYNRIGRLENFKMGGYSLGWKYSNVHENSIKWSE